MKIPKKLKKKLIKIRNNVSMPETEVNFVPNDGLPEKFTPYEDPDGRKVGVSQIELSFSP